MFFFYVAFYGLLNRRNAYFDFILKCINCSVWILFGVLVPYDQKWLYEFPGDWWRVFLLVAGVSGTLGRSIVEIRKVYSDSKYQDVSACDYYICHHSRAIVSTNGYVKFNL